MADLNELTTRGGVRITVGGQAHEIRLLMLRRDLDISYDEPVLALDDVKLLVREALESVVAYCRFSEETAGTNIYNPAAVGLTRAYKDIADRLDERFAREDASGT